MPNTGTYPSRGLQMRVVCCLSVQTEIGKFLQHIYRYTYWLNTWVNWQIVDTSGVTELKWIMIKKKKIKWIIFVSDGFIDLIKLSIACWIERVKRKNSDFRWFGRLVSGRDNVTTWPDWLMAQLSNQTQSWLQCKPTPYLVSPPPDRSTSPCFP